MEEKKTIKRRTFKFTFKKNKNAIDIAEVCKLASDYIYLEQSDYSDIIEAVLENDDSSIQEVLDSIREEMDDNNKFKEASDAQLKNIIKKNYIMVDLFNSCDYMDGLLDTTWDNANIQGAS